MKSVLLSQVSAESLPSWLTFDSARARFAGVPTEADLRPHQAAVRAVGSDGSSARDVFLVDVLPETGEPPGRRTHGPSGGERRQTGEGEIGARKKMLFGTILIGGKSVWTGQKEREMADGLTH